MILKKIILGLATFAVAAIAFLIYQWREEATILPRPAPAAQPIASRPVEQRPRSTQPALTMGRQDQTLNLTGTKVPPGEAPRVRVFDEETGEAKIVFQSTRWEPISDTEFALTEPNAQVLLPGGQLAFVQADAGQIAVQRGEKNNFEPKRGWFKGNVRIFVDRTTPQWRKANPDLADPAKHPEAVVKFWLEEVEFDLDLAQLTSKGTITVQSADGTIEGRGLELVWNEVNRRITRLRIAEGKQATFRSASLADFGMPGADAGKTAATRPAGGTPVAAATPARPIAEPPPAQAQPGESLTFAGPGDEAAPLKEDRIDAYRVVFRDNIVAEQKDGLKTVGRLKAAVLQVLFEVGQKEREAVQHVPGSRPADAPAKPQPAAAPSKRPDPLDAGSMVVLNWTGEVLITPDVPATQPEGGRSGSPERFHLIATGDPVEVFNRETGEARCRELEYHQESKQAWLRGTPTQWVRMISGPEGEIQGETIFFDGKTGVAQVNGPGQLLSSRKVRDELELPACMTGATATRPSDPKGRVQLAWKRSALIEFGLVKTESTDPATGQPQTRQSEYLKHAVFDGDVTLEQPGESMGAEHIDVTFKVPQNAGEVARDKATAERILARGRVRMFNDTDLISCDELDVEMTVDDAGRNVPRIGRATGRVLARQGEREIRAHDSLMVTLASIPKLVTEQERARLEAGARRCGYTKDSPEWKVFEQRLRERRETTITTLTARGDVSVRDPKEKLDVRADTLDCTFNEMRQITRATIGGTAENPAHAETADFYIRGPRIEMDVPTQSADVPGGGLLRFYTAQDLDGRQVDKPIPVVVTWTDHMALRGQDNVGAFVGTVKARSENSTLDCRELTLRFANLPKPANEAAAGSWWILQPLLNSARPAAEPRFGVGRMTTQMRKRLAHLRANGDAAIETKAYDDQAPASGGLVTRTLMTWLPEWMKAPEARAQDRAGRLVSGAYIAGPRIVIDLVEENLVVEGKGRLLLRDYRMPGRRRAGARRTGSVLADTGEASLTSYTPGHTVFTWQNSMSFLNRRNVAVFEQRIEMVHRSGSQLQMSPELAAATGLNAQSLSELKGRRVGLTTDHLLVEFQRDPSKGLESPTSLSKATKLKSFNARGRVRMQEGGRSLEGAEVTYRDETGLVRATGSSQAPPQAMDIDESTGALRAAWRGEFVEWNVKTGVVRAKESRILAPGR